MEVSTCARLCLSWFWWVRKILLWHEKRCLLLITVFVNSITVRTMKYTIWRYDGVNRYHWIYSFGPQRQFQWRRPCYLCGMAEKKFDISGENKNRWSGELCWSSGVLVVMPHGPPDQQEFEARVGVSYWLANRLASGLHSRFSKGLIFQFFRLKTWLSQQATFVWTHQCLSRMWCRRSTCKDTRAC